MSENYDVKHDAVAVSYVAHGDVLNVCEENLVKKREAARKRDARKDRKDKGYIMFEEEDSGEELMADDLNKSPTKVKKHVKATFKFTKKDKAPKSKEKDKDERREKEGREKAEKDKRDKDKMEKVDRDKGKERIDRMDKEKKDKVDKDKEKKEKIERDPRKEDDSKLRFRKKQTLIVTQVLEDLKPLFGIPLSLAVERSPCHDGILLPIVVRECVDYIEDFGLTCEGIYRISGVKSKVQALRDTYNRGVPVYLNEYEPNVVASLLKQFLRDLPEPVLTARLMPKFELASTIKNAKQKVDQFETLLKELPQENRVLLSWIIVHMTHVIALEKQNKMSLQNVSIVLSPTMQISHRVLNIFFGYSKLLFKDTVIRKYVPPLKPVTSRWSLELPDSPSAIEEELKKQESLLNHLHEELMNVKDMKKEEQLWEVQRVVTQLKRKLKHAKQLQQSADSSKRREDEILRDKTVQQQQLALQFTNQTAVEDNHGQIRMATDSSNENNKLSTEDLNQVVLVASYYENIENDGSTKKQDGSNTAFIQTCTQVVDNGSVAVEIAEGCEAGSTDLSYVDQYSMEGKLEKINELIQDTQISEIKPKLCMSSVSCTDRSADDILPLQDSKCEVVCSSSQEDNQIETPKVLEHGINEDDYACDELIKSASLHVAVESTSETVTEPLAELVQDRRATEAARTEITEIVAEAKQSDFCVPVEKAESVGRQSPSDVSSDAYTDVLDEDIDRLSEALDKEDCSGPPVYIELQNDLSALRDSPSINAVAVRCEVAETDATGKIATDITDEIEFDDPRPYSETTTSSDLSEFEDDDEYSIIEQDNIRLIMEEEELLAIGDELRQKICMEKREIERLHQDIIELRMIREDMSDSDHVTSDSSSDDCDEYDDDNYMHEILEHLLNENKKLEAENADLCDKIHQERQICIAIKVENRMMQQQHTESCLYSLDDCESLL